MKYLISAALLAVGIQSVAGASTLSLMSGSLSAGALYTGPINETKLSAGATGTFSVANSVSDTTVLGPDGHGGYISQTGVVSDAKTIAQITADGLTLSAVSNGSTYFQYPSFAELHSITETHGSLTFDVNALTTFNYSADSKWSSWETLEDSTGATLLSIACTDPFNSCGLDSGTAFQGSLQLGPGIYTLAFSDSAFQLAGTTQDSTMNFSLQAVPLPAAAWLLLSGLLPVFGWRRRA